MKIATWNVNGIRARDRLFTWWAPWRNMRQRNIGWRLDYVMATEGRARRATRCAVASEVGTSDHAPVVAEFAPDASGAAASGS